MNNREIIVKGIGKTSSTPDLIVLNLNIEVTAQDYDKTLQRNSEIIDKLREAIVSAGHNCKEIKTTIFNINTKYERYRESGGHKERFTGYTSYHNLTLEFDLDMSVLGKTLGEISKSGVKPNLNISFTIKDTNAISEKLLESAVENAKQKAIILTRASGVTLGTIQRIDYNWSEHHYYSQTDYRFNDVVCEEIGSYSMNIEPEEINIRDTATIVWSIT